MYSEVSTEEKKMIKNMEPDKCVKWFWASIDELRVHCNKLFYPTFLEIFPEMKEVEYIKKMIKTYKNYSVNFYFYHLIKELLKNKKNNRIELDLC